MEEPGPRLNPGSAACQALFLPCLSKMGIASNQGPSSIRGECACRGMLTQPASSTVLSWLWLPSSRCSAWPGREGGNPSKRERFSLGATKNHHSQKWVYANQEAEQGSATEKDRKDRLLSPEQLGRGLQICVRRKEPHRGPGEHIPAEKTEGREFGKQKLGLSKGREDWSLVQELSLRAQGLN